jgi:uncharacterized protein
VALLSGIRHVDHHAHGIVVTPPANLDEFRGLFSLSADPRQWPHVATQASYVRAIELLAAQLECEPHEWAVFERRRATDPSAYSSELLRASGADLILVDEAYPPPGQATSPAELAELADCPVRPLLRIEALPEEDVREAVSSARSRGYAALKSIAAYRGGLAHPSPALVTALELNEQSGDPLPVQVHTGFGDADLHLPSANPAELKPLIERFPSTPFVLLHCYPFVREAGWLASVYANVWFDLSLTIPHVSRPAEVLAEALELGPASKLLYASDGVVAPELYFLASVLWREALAAVVPEAAAKLILRENALSLYRL